MKKNYFLTGILSIIPLAITYFIISKLFTLFSNPGQKMIKYVFPNMSLPFLDIIIGFLQAFKIKFLFARIIIFSLYIKWLKKINEYVKKANKKLLKVQ